MPSLQSNRHLPVCRDVASRCINLSQRPQWVPVAVRGQAVRKHIPDAVSMVLAYLENWATFRAVGIPMPAPRFAFGVLVLGGPGQVRVAPRSWTVYVLGKFHHDLTVRPHHK